MHKGADRTSFKVSVLSGAPAQKPDEITNYQNARYLGPHEACWKLLGFAMHNTSHTFIRLPVHLHEEQNVVFTVEGEPVDMAHLPPLKDDSDDEDGDDDDGDDEGSIDLDSDAEDDPKKKRFAVTGNSPLPAYYQAVSAEVPGARYKFGPPASELTYVDFPQYYRYKKSDGWTRRSKRTFDKICVRLQTVSLVNPEIFYLRLLLSNVPGVKSEQWLKDGVLYNGHPCLTFHSACMSRGLAHDDLEWRVCLSDASLIQGQMGRELRVLYTTIFVHCHPTDAVQLFHEFADDMSDDYTYARNNHQRGTPTSSEDRYRALKWIHDRLGKDLYQDKAKILCLTNLLNDWDPAVVTYVKNNPPLSLQKNQVRCILYYYFQLTSNNLKAEF